MDEYLSFAKDLARQAGQIIKDGFESNLKVELKSDHTPVTQVDKAINDLVIQSINEKYPEHGVLGEEADARTGQEELDWLCDPLDGTKSFILGVPLTTFILGLTKNGQLLMSVVYHPFTDRLYHAVKGQGAFCNDKPINVDKISLADGAVVIVSESSFQFVEAIKMAGGQFETLPGAGYRSMLVATGKCAASIQGHADFHDTGPASLIVEEAGGKVTDLSGAPLRFDCPLTNGIILSNGVIHDQLVEIIK